MKNQRENTSEKDREQRVGDMKNTVKMSDLKQLESQKSERMGCLPK